VENSGAAERQITRRCCEGWYTPEGKALCSAKHNSQQQISCAECSEELRDLKNRVERLEKLLRSRPQNISGLEKRVEILEKFNRNHIEKISIMEGQIVNLTAEMKHIVEQQQGVIEERSATLSNDPCYDLTCPNHPEAMCLVTTRCGRDIAVFVDENFHTVNCNTNGLCDLLPPTYCTTDPCQGLTCNGYPNAFCVVADCDCTPTFMLPDGSKPSCLHDKAIENGGDNDNVNLSPMEHQATQFSSVTS